VSYDLCSDEDRHECSAMVVENTSLNCGHGLRNVIKCEYLKSEENELW
jgi:hypothetical protein